MPHPDSDPLISPDTLPGLVLTYRVRGPAATVLLETRCRLAAENFHPSGVETGLEAASRAAQCQRQYMPAAHQWAQPDLRASLLSSLIRGASGEPLPLPMTDGSADKVAQLGALAGAAAVLSGSLAQCKTATARACEVDGPLTPASIMTAYGVDIDSLAQANRDVPLDQLLAAASIEVPRFLPVDTLRTFAQQCPAGVDPFAVLGSAEAGALPLAPDVLLTMPQEPDAPTGYVTRPGDTLACNGSGRSQAELAPLNVSTVGLFPAGTRVLLETVRLDTPALTLASLARQQDIAAQDVLAFNLAAPIADGVAILPGRYAWPEDAGALRSHWRVPAEASLDAIAAKFALGPGPSAAIALAQMNESAADLVRGGLTLRIGDATFETVPGDCLRAICDRTGIGLDDLVEAVRARTDVLTAGATLIVPPAVLPGTTALTPVAAARPFDTSGPALLCANAGMPGLLVPGLSLIAAPSSEATERIAPHDTLASMVQRFQRRGVATSVAQLACANAGIAFVAAGARVLLPPPEATFVARLPWDEATKPEPFFAVQTWLALDRLAPEGEPLHAAASSCATPGARARVDAEHLVAGAQPDWDTYAEDVETAIPALRIARPPSDAKDPLMPWAAAFDEAGIAAVHAPPRNDTGAPPSPACAYALRPLRNAPWGTRTVAVQDLDTVTGRLADPRSTTFKDIDLERWAQEFLADMDALLEADSARTAERVRPEALDSIRASRHRLVAAIAEGLTPLFEAQTDSSGLAHARDALGQALDGSLAQGFAAAAVVQRPAQVKTGSPAENGCGLWLEWSPLSTAAPEAQRAGEGDATVIATTLPIAPDEASQVSLVLQVPDGPDRVSIRHRLAPWIMGLAVNGRRFAFIHPFAPGTCKEVTIDLGDPIVPLVSRECPPPVAPSGHEALGPDDPRSVAEATRWTYRWRWQHRMTARDRLMLTLHFNPQDSHTQAPASDAPRGDLFDALARYMWVADPLRSLLAGLRAGREMGADALPDAIDTFASLAGAVALAWEGRWRQQSPAPLRGDGAPAVASTSTLPVSLSLALTLQVDGSACRSLTLTRDVSTFGRPQVVCIVRGEPVALTIQPDATELVALYAFPSTPEVPMGSIDGFEMSLNGLHIGRHQAATVDARVEGNAALADTGASGAGPVSPALVCHSAEASWAEPVRPLLDVPAVIDIGPWRADTASNPMTAVFQEIFDGDATDRRVRVDVRYRFRMADGDTGLFAELPVVLMPPMTYSPATPVALAEAMKTWFRANRPDTADARWAIGLDLLSSDGPDTNRRVLQFAQLESRYDPAAAGHN